MKKFLIIISVLMLAVFSNAYASENLADGMDITYSNGISNIDLGRIYEIGGVEVEFAGEQPEGYTLEISKDNNAWQTVAAVKYWDNSGKALHSIIPAYARYIRADAEVSAFAVFAPGNKSINAKLATPSAGEKYIFPDTPIKVTFDKEINAAYLGIVSLCDENGNKIETKATLSGDRRSVILTPENLLAGGGKYTVRLKDFQQWTFKVSGGVMKDAKSYITTGKMRINVGNAENSIDGDSETAAGLGMADRYAKYHDYSVIFTYKLKHTHSAISRIYVEFAETPSLFAVEYSTDGVSWNEAARVYTKGQSSLNIQTEPFAAGYIRLRSIEIGMRIKEIDAYGSEQIGNLKVSADVLGNLINLKLSEGADPNTVYDGIKLFCGKEEKSFDCEISSDGKTVSLSAAEGLVGGASYQLDIDENLKTPGGEPYGVQSISVNIPQETELVILTKSDTSYMSDRENSIYPAFADGLDYQSWTAEGAKPFYQIKATGGRAPYTFEIINGRLPEGLTLGADGKISGKATKEETVPFTIKVTDVLGNSVEKALSMTANPYRSKWFRDAGFGVMTQWGVYSLPAAGIAFSDYKTDIANFENLIDGKFNAEKWAQQLENMGVGVFNWTVIAGDIIRMYPSQIPSAKGASLSRDMVGELVGALHRHNIKFIGYVAPDGSWSNSPRDFDPDTGTVSRLIVNCVKELIEMGLDGIWLDAGWTDGFVDWDVLVPTVRSINPYATIQSNPSVASFAVVNYPNVDIQLFEGPNLDTTDAALHTAHMFGTDKKTALEQTLLLGNTWGPSANDYILKSTDAVIASIKNNWDNGATPLLVFPVEVDGSSVVCEKQQQVVTEITDWVKANKPRAEMPSANLSEGVEYSEPQTLILSAGSGDRIYYTLDGSNPTDASNLYSEPIEIKNSSVLRAVAYKDGASNKSDELKVNIKMADTAKANKLADAVRITGNELPTETRLVGMLVTVKDKDIRLESIGRHSDDSTPRHIAIYHENVDKPYLVWENAAADEHDGDFTYYNILPVVLKAYQKYYILVEERAGEEYDVTSFDGINTNGLYVDGGAFTDPTLTRIYGTDAYSEAPQRHLNIKFRYADAANGKSVTLTAFNYDGSGKISDVVTETSEAMMNGDTLDYKAFSGRFNVDMELDLGEVQSVGGIELYRIKRYFAGNDNAAANIKVSVSEDGVSYDNLGDMRITDITGSGARREQHLYLGFAQRQVRYIKLSDYSNHNGTQIQPSEIIVIPGGESLISGKSVALTGYLYNGSGNKTVIAADAENYGMTNGSTTDYKGFNGAFNVDAEIDLGGIQYVNEIKLYRKWRYFEGIYGHTANVAVQVSADDSTYKDIGSMSITDLAVSEDGKLKEQLLELNFSDEAVRYIRLLDRDNHNGTSASPSEIEVKYDKRNIARGAGAEMCGASGTVYEPSSVYKAAGNAIDGDYTTVAQSSGEYAWTLSLDLRAKKKVDRIFIHMNDTGYATRLAISYSDDKETWTKAKTIYANTSAGLDINTEFEAKYIKIEAIKPDGPGQKGGQTVIREVEIYGY